jgi:hypothetical protein
MPKMAACAATKGEERPCVRVGVFLPFLKRRHLSSLKPTGQRLTLGKIPQRVHGLREQGGMPMLRQLQGAKRNVASPEDGHGPFEQLSCDPSALSTLATKGQVMYPQSQVQ